MCCNCVFVALPETVFRHMNLNDYADKIEKAALTVRLHPVYGNCIDQHFQTIAEGKTITGDLGGRASTKQYTDAIIQKLKH